jgi:hypothetical protein
MTSVSFMVIVTTTNISAETSGMSVVLTTTKGSTETSAMIAVKPIKFQAIKFDQLQ